MRFSLFRVPNIAFSVHQFSLQNSQGSTYSRTAYLFSSYMYFSRLINTKSRYLLFDFSCNQQGCIFQAFNFSMQIFGIQCISSCTACSRNCRVRTCIQTWCITRHLRTDRACACCVVQLGILLELILPSSVENA